MCQAGVQVGVHRLHVGVEDCLCTLGRQQLLHRIGDGQEEDGI